MKKTVSALLSLIIMLTAFPVMQATALGADGYLYEEASDSGSCGNGVYWFYDSQSKTLSFNGKGAICDLDENSEMRWRAFSNEALSITIGEGITSICDSAFMHFKNAKILELPSTLTEIGSNAFLNCAFLSLTIPESVVSIGDCAFSRCTGIKSVRIPDGLTRLGADAFLGCSGLEYNTYEGGRYIGSKSNPYALLVKWSGVPEFVPADGVKFIDKNAFARNITLAEARIPESVLNCEAVSFSGCTGLETVKLPSTLESIPAAMFENCKALSKIQIPETVKSIGKYAFRYCTALSEIDIPDSVETVGADAFLGCSALEKVSIGKALNYTDRIFNGCDSVKAVSVSAENSNLSYQNGMIINGDTAIDAFPAIVGENLVVPPAVKAIGDSIFEGFSVKSVAFSEGLEKIGARSFKNCKSLVRISFPDSLVSIDTSAFEFCSGLEYVRVGKSLKSINAGAFSGCKNLLEVEDDSLLALKAAQGTTQYGAIVRYATNVICPSDVYVEIDGCSFKKNESGNYILISYTGTEKNLVLPETVNGKTYEIGKEAFANTELESVVIPDTVRKIGAYAFKNSKKLTRITLGKGIDRLCNDEFAYSSVETVDMSSRMVLIYPTAFVNCELKQINFMGTREMWNRVNIDWERFSTKYDQSIYDRSALTNVTVVCYCTENGHTEARRAGEASTCLKKGTEIVYCSVCDETLDITEAPLGRHHNVRGVCTVCNNKFIGDLDGNGKVTSLDSYIMKRVILGFIVSAETRENADINGDGKVTSMDSFLQKRLILGTAY